MKTKNIASAALFAAVLLAGCGMPATQGTNTGTNTSTNTNSTADILGGIAGAAIGGNAGDVASTAINVGTVISGIIGQLTNQTSATSIVGTWVYQEPSVQFESENLLAKAGGAVAGNAIVNKLVPYYQSIGITPGKFSLTLNSDNTCSYTMSGQTAQGTYTYDADKNKVTIKGTLLNFPTAYVTVSANNLALTFDSSKILSIAQTVAGGTQNATISGIGELSKSFSGMKTGFLFKKQ